MAHDQFLCMARPKSLLDLATHSLFRVISKLIPEHTRTVEWCTICKLNMSNYYGLGVDAENKKCRCFRYYQQIVHMLCDLPFELSQRIVDVAQKELDNSNSVQVLLGIWMAFLDLMRPPHTNISQENESGTPYGLKYIATPLYLYNDHDSRDVILRQLIRVGEMYNSNNLGKETIDDYPIGNKTCAKNEGSKYIMHPLSSYLSFNMYKFNYEIGKKEYVIDGKSERRLRTITENNQRTEQEIPDRQDGEESLNHTPTVRTTKLCNCSICNYTQEKLMINEILMLYTSHLHTLILPTVADINLLHTLSSIATQLKVLDLSFSMCVEDEAITSTIGKDSKDNVCRGLMHICLDGTNVTEKAVLNIIQCQRNLEHVESEFLTSALIKIISDSNNSLIQTISSPNAESELIEEPMVVKEAENRKNIERTPLSLTRLCIKSPKCIDTDHSFEPYHIQNYNQDPNSSIQDLTLLQRLGEICPQIEHLTIPRLHSNQVNVLKQAFQSLPYLAHLYMGEIKVTFLEPLLSKLDNRLLSLQHSNFSDIVDLRIIADYCSNLTFLAVNAAAVVISGDNNNVNYLISTQKSTSEFQSGIMYKTQRKYLFPRLKEIRFNIHAIIPKYVWTDLFIECRSLEGIDITSPESMTDSNLLNILTSQYRGCDDHEGIRGEGITTAFPLCNVTSFFIRGRHCCGDVQLTEESINNLSRYCKRLKHIGDCSTWSLSKTNE